ncbi:MAG: hypothetical protein OEO79_06420 [Gemmatimonadota bacterium]|nr:hypothetical protein [Gemmatimonadota bacterium]
MSPSARQLSERVAGVRDHLRRRAALAVTPWVVTGVVWVLLLAWLTVGSDGWRQGSNVPALFDALMILWVVLGLIVVWLGVRRWFGEVPLARAIERAAGLHPGTVRGSLELSRDLPVGVSGSLAARAVARTASDLGGRDAEDLSGELGRTVGLWTRRGLIAASVSFLVLAALGISTPDRTAKVWAGVSSPIRTMIDPVFPAIVVTPGDIEVLRGTDVPVRIEASGRFEVALSWQAAGDVARSQLLNVDQGRATHVFEAVTATTEYRVELPDGSGTATYTIVPIDPLFVSDLVIEVTYPPHTGIASDEYRGDAPPLRLPVGSRLDIQGAASRPLAGVSLIDSAGNATLTMDVDGVDFAGTWTPSVEGLFDWAFRDVTGAPAELQPEPLEIDLIADSLPTVAILLPGQDTILPLSLQQPLVVDARDDYGLRRVELVAYRVTAFGDRHEPVVQGLDLEGTRGALARPILDFREWQLLPGDTVRYFARVVDNNPRGQTATTPEYVLRMLGASELDREAEGTLEESAARLEELRAEAERLAEQNRNRSLETANQRNAQNGRGDDPNQPDFRQQEELRRALEEQAAMIDNVDSLSARLEALERRMEEAGQADPELVADLEELQDLLQQLQGNEEMRERMAELAEALQAENQEQANQSLGDLAEQQQRFSEQVGDALESFRRAAVEQDFRATTSEAEELARLEQALADALREADDPELRAEQQGQLADRAEALDDRMEQLQERLEQLNEQTAASRVEEARQAAADAGDQMQRAEQQARQGDAQAAGDQAQQAADQMDQAASQLQQAQDGMADQTQQAAQSALRQTADDALSLARRQAELTQRMSGASQQEIADMRGDMASLQRGLQNVAENLRAGTEATGGTPQLSAQVGQALQSLEQTIEALQNSRSSPSSRAARSEEAIGNLNQVAVMAMATADQMGTPSGAGASGQDVVEQMGQLAQRQGELLAQTGELMPMRLGEQAMAEQLSNLSQQQQSVAQDLGDLAGDPGADDALGDLDEFAREAAFLAQQLAQGRLTPEIVREQERLFHRLLDAGRSLEREEFTEERESEAPGAFERGDVVPLSALQLGAMRYELPDGEQLRRLSPAVRQLVLEYFERLNRGDVQEGDVR